MKTQNSIHNQHCYPALKCARDISMVYFMLLISVLIIPLGQTQADIKRSPAGLQNTTGFPSLYVVGHGRLTWFGLSIYQASLWTATGDYQNLNESIPIALTITYQKNIASDALAQRTAKLPRVEIAEPPSPIGRKPLLRFWRRCSFPLEKGRTR